MQLIVLRCDSRVYRGSELGSQDDGSLLRIERDTGVALSSSDCNAAFLDSRSIICNKAAVRYHVAELGLVARTFFCNRTTLVHFFSSNPLYLSAVARSNAFSSRFRSVLRAATAAVSRFAVRYAMIDLCLMRSNISITDGIADSTKVMG
jgi:hypothetical protein